jgi:hypothetical protein
MSNEIITYKVSYHPSGNRTLVAHKDGKAVGVDVTSPTEDPAIFYRKVAHILGSAAERGEYFRYKDTTLDNLKGWKTI